MKMYVQIQRAAKTLNNGHRAAAPVHDPGRPRLAPQEAEHRARERPHHRAAQVVIPGQPVAQAMRQAQDPLAHGHRWEHTVDQVRGALGHAPSATARAIPAATTRKLDEPIQVAPGTTKPREAAGQPAAAEKGAELLLDEPRQPFAIAQVGGLCAKRLEVLADHLVQHTLRGVPRLIARGR